MVRGYLAEAYDGISQYVLITLAKSSTAAAYKARVASGDFNTSRTFPIGTPVHIVPYRGQLEVHLGGRPVLAIPCQDPFSRTVAGSWGTSPILNKTWSKSTNGQASVDGAVGILSNTVDAQRCSNWLALSEWSGDDLEVLAKVRLVDLTGMASPSLYGTWFSAGDQTTVFSSGPSLASAPRFTALFEESATGGLRIDVTALDNSGAPGVDVIVDNVISDIGNQWFWMRWRMEATTARLKVWLHGTSEPGSYQAEGTDAASNFLSFSIGLGVCDTFVNFGQFNTGASWEIDSLQFVSGLNC